MDPYCKVKAGEQKFKTAVKDGAGKEPVWNEAFDIDVEGVETVKISVKDEDVDSSDKIGKAFINVADLTAEGGFDLWVDIEHDGKISGQVHVVVKGGPVNEDAGDAVQEPEPVVEAPPKKELKNRGKQAATFSTIFSE